MTRFTLPRDLYFGSGSIEKLGELKGNKAVIVLGRNSMRKYGFLDSAIGYLNTANIEVKLIENIEPDPSIQTIQYGATVMQEFQPDIIVALGGGSVIDAAKAMWIFYENPDITLPDLLTPYSVPVLRKKAILVAVPSTAGTSSETTAFSIITDKTKGIKHPIVDYQIVPDIAILDTDITATMSKELIAYTGMDALTHAIEASVSTHSNDFTFPLAINSIRMIFKFLYSAYNGDELALAKMHYAQYQAGMSFSNANLGIIHSIAHKLGLAFENTNIPHGCLNAICLPHVISFNAKVEITAIAYSETATTIGLKGDSVEDLVLALIKAIQDFNETLEIPRCLKEYDNGAISEEEYLSKIDEIAKYAIEDSCTKTNPRIPSHDEMVTILKACYYGDICEL